MGKNTIQFSGSDGTFRLRHPERISGLYLPVAGETLKSAVTPSFGGDIKLDQNHFVMEPVSVENLHNNRSARAFWCRTDKEAWCATDEGSSILEAGFMWQSVKRTSEKMGLESEVTVFIPKKESSDKAAETEVLLVRITNRSDEEITFRPTAVVPLYGRSAANLRDHRDVTAMLNRSVTIPEGVVLRPTLSFDERGHLPNDITYFVCGYMFPEEEKTAGILPEDFYPSESGYIGEGGSFSVPRSVLEDWMGLPAGTRVDGQEVTGGLHFPLTKLAPEQSVLFAILTGAVADSADEENKNTERTSAVHNLAGSLLGGDRAPDTSAVQKIVSAFAQPGAVQDAFEETKAYWQKQVNASFYTGSQSFDNFMRWVSFQPILRRIYGCSFLPHHDYGKGGRGWRDLWQDCLALLLMDPDGVREMILSNFAGVRMDGTNATIIGANPGEFLADRNSITRVWMDHGYWPLGTVKLYIDQTGDLDILGETAGYFKDGQTERAHALDERWNPAYGTMQKDAHGDIYEGTVLEHLLLQNLTACLELGEHGMLRLRDADWNDALDMAGERGESTAFSCAYAGNLKELADLVQQYTLHTGRKEILLAEELLLLLEASEDSAYVLQQFLSAVKHEVSGKKASTTADKLIQCLLHKADALMDRLRTQEWITDGEGCSWCNSYYDNSGRRVEGVVNGDVRMMLTGQVFSVMSGTATDEQVQQIAESADKYLFDRAAGGYRLNTNFREIKTDLGRMFGFAYGEKENGAVFSHMTVMYANALYGRGFIREGYKALQTLADTALDFERSCIFPGIPEYFSSNEILSPVPGEPYRENPGLSRVGRGRYHYLTGAASWYMLTMITQVFGVRGLRGDLLLEPKLTAAQFDADGNAAVKCLFAGKIIRVSYQNPEHLHFEDYEIGEAQIGDRKLSVPSENPNRVLIARDELDADGAGSSGTWEDPIEIRVILKEKDGIRI